MCAHTHISTQAHIHAHTRHVQERDKERRDIHLFAQRLPLASLLTSIFFSFLSPTRVLSPLAILPPHPPPHTRCVGQAAREGCLPATLSKNTKRIWRGRRSGAAYFPRGFVPLVQETPLSRGGSRRQYNSKVELYRGEKKTVLNIINTSSWHTNVQHLAAKFSRG